MLYFLFSSVVFFFFLLFFVSRFCGRGVVMSCVHVVRVEGWLVRVGGGCGGGAVLALTANTRPLFRRCRPDREVDGDTEDTDTTNHASAGSSVRNSTDRLTDVRGRTLAQSKADF